MAYGRRESSIFDSFFSLSPLPYPVLFILLIILLLLSISWSSTYDDIIETAEEQLSWLLLATPIALLLLIRWLSSFDSFGGFFGFYPYDRRGRGGGWYSHGGQASSSEGSSPWGVAAVVVLLLVLVSFQSSFQDMWRP